MQNIDVYKIQFINLQQAIHCKNSKNIIVHKNSVSIVLKQGRKRPLDTPKRMIERKQREGEREKERQRYREGGSDKEKLITITFNKDKRMKKIGKIFFFASWLHKYYLCISLKIKLEIFKI